MAYLFATAAYVWSVGGWLTSETLRNLRVGYRKKRNREKVRSPFVANAWAVGLISVFFVLTLVIVGYVNTTTELLAMNGILIPANDPIEGGMCRIAPHSSAIVVTSGMSAHAAAATDSRRSRLSVLSVHYISSGEDKALLSADREADGRIAISALVTDTEGRTVVEIDKSRFLVNRNRILNSDTPPRPDRSTIVIQDEYRNTLKIRMMNANMLLFQGRLFYDGRNYVEFGDDGIFTGPPRRKWISTMCMDINGSAPGVLGVEAP